jgi:hypothetical protein
MSVVQSYFLFIQGDRTATVPASTGAHYIIPQQNLFIFDAFGKNREDISRIARV